MKHPLALILAPLLMLNSCVLFGPNLSGKIQADKQERFKLECSDFKQRTSSLTRFNGRYYAELPLYTWTYKQPWFHTTPAHFNGYKQTGTQALEISEPYALYLLGKSAAPQESNIYSYIKRIDSMPTGGKKLAIKTQPNQGVTSLYFTQGEKPSTLADLRALTLLIAVDIPGTIVCTPVFTLGIITYAGLTAPFQQKQDETTASTKEL